MTIMPSKVWLLLEQTKSNKATKQHTTPRKKKQNKQQRNKNTNKQKTNKQQNTYKTTTTAQTACTQRAKKPKPTRPITARDTLKNTLPQMENLEQE